jgi:N-acetylglucosamine-6-phosphate deacetylase
LNPAQAVGLAAKYGRLAAGAEATFVVLSSAGDVLKTIVGARGL